ncbi:MAG: acVLRF1 family peptidyl-tRNA hydrolase [Motilibacteraceae bacterium]
MSRPAAGGGRWVEVAPERLERWLVGFADRHGGAAQERLDDGSLRLVGADGEQALVTVPFPPLADGVDVVAHALALRRIGLVLLRRGGYAVGVAQGERLVASKVGSRHVQGRTAAGGWSQQRFARRREGQTREAVQAAVDVVARLLLPEALTLDAVVTGGDKTLLSDLLSEPRLAPLRPLVVERVLDVPDPRRDVLEAAVAAARAVPIHLTP